MGNCMETCIHRPQQEEKQQKQQLEAEENLGRLQKETSNRRIKIVLTKVELEWLMFQLKDKEGKSVEDVLGEIERSREIRAVGWKPSLESITEIPEVQEMDR